MVADVPPSFVIDYQHPGDKVEDGDWIPVITVTLRPAMRLEDGNVDRMVGESAIDS